MPGKSSNSHFLPESLGYNHGQIRISTGEVLQKCHSHKGMKQIYTSWQSTFLDENERGEWKSWLKDQHSEKKRDHGIQSHHFMTNIWRNSGNCGKFSFLGSNITADGDCSHEIKRCLLLGRKVMTSLDSTLKSRDITLPTKVCLIKAMVFPVTMYGCES